LTTTFNDFGLAEPIQRAVTELGYREPTPIQVQAIPHVLVGRDVMGAAQTGTGKTAGFALPILQRLMPHANASASPARHPIRALVIAPTRELADQIYVNFAAYAKHTNLKSAVVYGGVDIRPQLAAMRAGCEVLIATPGRLLDHIEQRTANLSQVEIFVMDEADRMLDMGFLPDIQRIINLLPKRRQNLMFSATFSGEIRKLAESFLNDPISIEVARRNATNENVEQRVYVVSGSDAKRAAVAKLVRDHGLAQVIVFTNTKIGASRLARELARDGLNADAIHGDKSQQERLATLEAFKRGETAVLVATDVAARGLDIAELPAVINYDLPYSPEDYVHRIGRTGRAGAKGIALSLMTAADERLLVEIEKLIKRKLQPDTIAVEARREPRDDEGSADRGRAQRGDRSDRGEGSRSGESRRRRDHDESGRPGRSGGRAADLAPRGNAGPMPGYSSDPFFFKPYEPAVEDVDVKNGDDSASDKADSTRSRRRPLHAIAALLGGKKPS
jgi:ATP-dependent RNA helicase RhlE